MALYLYRLGRLAARRAWAVVFVWILVLGLTAGGALTLGRPFTTKLTIPGTEFQAVLDDLERSLPKAAGGSGTVVVSTKDGAVFTQAQKKAIADVTDSWSQIEGVKDAADPFVTQKQLDDAAKQVRDGRAKLSDGQTQITANEAKSGEAKAQLTAGQAQIDASAAKLAEGERQLVAGEAKLADGQRQYDAGLARLTAGERQWSAGAAKARQGRSQLEAGKAALAKNQREIAAGRAQLAPQLAGMPGMKSQLAALKTQEAKLQLRLAALPPGQSQAELRAAIAQVQGGIKQLEQGIATVTAAKAALDQGQAKLDAGSKQLAAKERELVAGERTLAATRSELSSGKAQLNASKAQLDSGRAQLAASRTQLADGKAKLAAGRAQLADGKAKLAAGEKLLADAKAQLPGSETKLVQGERRIALLTGLRAVNDKGNVAVTQIMFDKPMDEVDLATKDAIPTKSTALADAGLRIDYSKDIAQNLDLFGPGELIGVVVATVVLLVMLGSLLAAGLPLLTALIGVAVGLLGAVALTQWVDMQDITPALALMLGLAVGIDYSLFLVNRHREQLAQGLGLEESVGRATGTAGSAVVVAGLTVIVALSALALTGIPFLGTMGYVAAGTVAVAVLVAITLTPALLGLMGQRVLSSRARRTLAATLAAQEAEAEADDAGSGAGLGSTATATTHVFGHDRRHEGRGHGWGGLVTRHPIVTLVATTIILGVLAIPAASLRLGLPDGSYEPHDSTSYRSYTAIGDNFGAGRNGPIIAVAKLGEERAREVAGDALTDLDLTVGERLRQVPGVAYVVPVGASEDKRTLIYQVVPRSGPSDDATSTLVRDLRSARAGIVDGQRLESMGFAGQTVANIDISQSLADALPKYLGVVVSISLILLLLVFRSIVVPVLATAGFLLSVAAAFGALVAVYQWGWLGFLFGVERPGLVLSFLPTLVIGILFGLAMDYQMFLVSGMREAWAHGHKARTAVRTGFSHGSRVVTAAALIMTAVFASFIHAKLTMIRPIGFSLALGVLIDAFVVRMTAMPAIMHLLGERAWYIPAWLDRILPNLDVEGTKLVGAAGPDRPETPRVGPGGSTDQGPGDESSDDRPEGDGPRNDDRGLPVGAR